MASAARTPGERALTAGEIAVLAGYGARVRESPDDEQAQIAQAAAAYAARHYRARGAGWEAIARALGIPAAVLRDWRGDNPEAKARPNAAAPARWDATRQPAARPARQPALRPMVYVALGSMRANGNDFAGEAAAIRRMLTPRKIGVAERCAVEISELRQELAELRPTVVHVAAHFAIGSVHLSLDGDTMAVLVDDLRRVLWSVPAPPALVVLNGCDTAYLAEQLTRPDPAGDIRIAAAVGWDGQLSDRQGRLFAERFYAGLACGDAVGAVFEGPSLIITARWPRQAQPRLSGATATRPLRIPGPAP